MNKYIFLDRDGTINKEKNYLYKIEEFELLDGVVKALKGFMDLGYKLVIITNQSGIARGVYTEEDYEKLTNYMLNLFEKESIKIERVYYCPHHPEGIIKEYRKNCDCRKPKLGLFEKAIKELKIDITNSIAIGDKLRDCTLGVNNICQSYLINNNEKKNIIDEVKNNKYKYIKYSKNILSCLEEIKKIDKEK